MRPGPPCATLGPCPICMLPSLVAAAGADSARRRHVERRGCNVCVPRSVASSLPTTAVRPVHDHGLLGDARSDVARRQHRLRRRSVLADREPNGLGNRRTDLRRSSRARVPGGRGRVGDRLSGGRYRRVVPGRLVHERRWRRSPRSRARARRRRARYGLRSGRARGGPGARSRWERALRRRRSAWHVFRPRAERPRRNDGRRPPHQLRTAGGCTEPGRSRRGRGSPLRRLRRDDVRLECGRLRRRHRTADLGALLPLRFFP